MWGLVLLGVWGCDSSRYHLYTDPKHTTPHTHNPPPPRQLPFDTRENPEVDSLRGAFTTRIILGNLGGACWWID